MKSLQAFKVPLIVILIIAALGYGGYSYYQSKKAAEVKIDTVKVEVGDIKTTVSATGTIAPVNSVDVNSKISGRIVEVLVKENDWVTEGQMLFVLDDQQYKSALSKSEATLNNATLQYNRMRSLWQRGAVARSEYDSAEKEYLIAKADYDNAVSDLGDTIIKAPVTGLVVGKPKLVGQTVSPGISEPMVLMTIADMSIVQSETLVDETDIGKIALSQKVDFTVDAYDDITFHGIVSLISRKAETANNVIYYKVYVDVDDAKDKLFPDMTSRVTIYANEVSDVLTLPLSTVRENTRGKFVYKKLSEHKFEEVAVTTGLRSDDRIEIKSGVKAGDEIAQRPSVLNNANITTVGDTSSSADNAQKRTQGGVGGSGRPRGPRIF